MFGFVGKMGLATLLLTSSHAFSTMTPLGVETGSACEPVLKSLMSKTELSVREIEGIGRGMSGEAGKLPLKGLKYISVYCDQTDRVAGVELILNHENRKKYFDELSASWKLTYNQKFPESISVSYFSKDDEVAQIYVVGSSVRLLYLKKSHFEALRSKMGVNQTEVSSITKSLREMTASLKDKGNPSTIQALNEAKKGQLTNERMENAKKHYDAVAQGADLIRNYDIRTTFMTPSEIEDYLNAFGEYQKQYNEFISLTKKLTDAVLHPQKK